MNTQNQTKPECRLCKKEEGRISETLAKELVYSLFNPYSRKKGEVDVRDYIREHMKENLSDSIDEFNEINTFGFLNTNWIEKMDRMDEYRKAREKAWEQIKRDINEGRIDESELSPTELLDHLKEEIIEDLVKEGYIDGYERRRYFKRVIYNARAEKLIAEKILELVLSEIKPKMVGDAELPREGISIFSGNSIVEYDPFIHLFDNIDIHETFVRNKGFRFKDIVARAPKHREKIVYVMLIDVSDSMRGKKFVGAIESAIGLRKVIERRAEKELRVVSFNHDVREVNRGEILSLYPHGRTDIGLALRKAREIVERSNSSGVIFLITDGEPTSSYNPHISPSMCAVREAKKLRNLPVNLSILMLGNDENFRRVCERMAEACRRSKILYFSDPLDLKNYFMRNYS
ncbi:hypothetical protein Asulf_00497 [Archaeoglobus sulfaticallidus PM70-1]|uniref:VWFA domain-containing protein n=1 Tax=Archaeoglobus sulfaticallidus PM70-1 TaxID=387631 RepID=N0BK69_9EURY|nr:vWA domain-containing protein [Archaeoglobus sulfaticallidus]AGK60520.1 hypothetical protein Asulf_00497 [Archaeoglobus sulfaticallidus PM70-1]